MDELLCDVVKRNYELSLIKHIVVKQYLVLNLWGIWIFAKNLAKLLIRFEDPRQIRLLKLVFKSLCSRARLRLDVA